MLSEIKEQFHIPLKCSHVSILSDKGICLIGFQDDRELYGRENLHTLKFQVPPVFKMGHFRYISNDLVPALIVQERKVNEIGILALRRGGWEME